MRISTRSKVTIVAGLLGVAALLGSTATATAGTLAAARHQAVQVAAMAPQGMPDPGMPQGAQPNEMPEP